MSDADPTPAAGDDLFALQGEYTIHTVGERADALAQGIARGAWRLDLSGVTNFDSAGLQLLLAARATLAERGQELELSGASQPVRAVLVSYALAPDLTSTGIQ